MASLHIGTSGWHYPHWHGRFYPGGLKPEEWLGFYARKFACVEVNTSFYSPLDSASIQRWCDAVPDDFRFAVKAPKSITHLHKLRNASAELDSFLESVQPFGTRLGPLLFQLPPRWHCNIERLQSFLELLPNEFRYSFEFRDRDWHRPEVYVALEQAGAAFCVFDLAGTHCPQAATSELVYIRLHGPDGAYSGSYSAAALRTWGTSVDRWLRQGRDVYVFFDNDEQAYSIRNALSMLHHHTGVGERAARTVRSG